MNEMVSRFRLEGTPILCEKFGPGHINETYLIVTNQPHLYILQNVNTRIFTDPEGLMENIRRVTEHLRKKDPDPRHVLRLVPTTEGSLYILTAERQLWRVYEYITGGVSMDAAQTADDFRQSAVAFGAFQCDLADFPAAELKETIPRFHDTPNRYRNLRQAMRENRSGRLDRVGAEIAFLAEREEKAGTLTQMIRSGELPLRVTHNDTKLNNVMLDEKTREPMCIMDLDTVMPGLVAYDFGDSIRFGASTAVEDEPDPDKVHLDMGLYRAYADGFLSACGSRLTEAEVDSLPLGAWTMTVENAVRFLSDYLDGDTYYHTDYPDHNLVRTRTQIRLAAEMEAKADDMLQIVRTLHRS